MSTFQPVSLPSFLRKTGVISAAAAITMLAACNKPDNGQTVGQKIDAAVTSTEKAATDAKAKAQESLNKAGDVVKDATQKAEADGSKAADAVVGQVDDMAITASVAAGFAKDADLSAIKIDVDTKNGKVTLYGPAPSATARDRASVIAKSVKGVAAVENKLVVKGS